MPNRLLLAVHIEQPLGIAEIASDFQGKDAWTLRTRQTRPDDFPVVSASFCSGDKPATNRAPVRHLVAPRPRLGGLFGCAALGAVGSLPDRPADYARSESTASTWRRSDSIGYVDSVGGNEVAR